MSHYTRTPRMVTPRLVPQPTPVVYAPANTGTPYYNHSSTTLGRRQSLGSYIPGPQVYHVAASEPSHSRSHHRSSSKSHKHRRPHSVDRHGGSRHHRHSRRSSTPSRSMYSPEVQYATIPSGRHRRHSHSVPDHHYSSSSREPHRAVHHSHHDHHYVTHHRESIGERIKRFFGIGTHRTRLVDSSGHQVDRLGRPIYAV